MVGGGGKKMKGKRAERGCVFWLFVFFKTSLNKDAPKHPNRDALGSLQCPKGLYYRVAFF